MRKKKADKAEARTAEEPKQAVNIDLCFVPKEHAIDEPLPAVSGSSGHLIVAQIRIDGAERQWPGQVFGNEELDYIEAMQQYIAATRDRLLHRKSDRPPSPVEVSNWRKEWESRAERYYVREQRKQADAAWRTAKTKWRLARQAYQVLTRSERREQQANYQLAQQAWEQTCQQYQEVRQQWKLEDQAWHQGNRKRKSYNPEQRSWLAILVVTDNCSRQCLGLPVFSSGSKVTSAEVTAALRPILPQELLFLISDQGAHFRSKMFADLAQDLGFIHVPVYRHRPQCNGIAERFVLTLKDWLQSKTWNEANDLHTLLTAFQPEYNVRPHQGLPIPGLSPDEFAKRIWLM